MALPDAATIEAPVRSTSKVLRSIAALMGKIDKQCIHVFDLDESKRDPQPDTITEEPAECEDQQADLLKQAARDPVAAADLWWVLWARGAGLLHPGQFTLFGHRLDGRLPDDCKGHHCDTREPDIKAGLEQFASREQQAHYLVYTLQQFALGKTARPNAKNPAGAQYEALTDSLFGLADNLGCKPAEWQELAKAPPKATLDDARQRCAPWWLQWFATHRGKAAQWPAMAKDERLVLLKSPDLALRIAAMDLQNAQQKALRAELIAAARPVWIDARTPRPIAVAFGRRAVNVGIGWYALLNGPGSEPINMDWALVPLTGPAGPPDDPPAVAPPAAPTLTTVQATWLRKTVAKLQPFMQECRWLFDGDGGGGDPATCRRKARQLGKFTDPLTAAYALEALFLDGVDDFVPSLMSEKYDAGTAINVTQKLFFVSDRRALVTLMARRLQKALLAKEQRATTESIKALRDLTGVAVCAVLPWDTTRTAACAQQWYGFAAAQLGNSIEQWQAYGQRRAVADVASADLVRQYAACEFVTEQSAETINLSVVWAVRNAVLSSKVPEQVGDAFAALVQRLNPLDILYPAAPGQLSTAPNLALPPK